MSDIVTEQVTKAVTPIMLLVSLNFFLQGHNLPGGGFIAGVMAAAGLALFYIVFNLEGIDRLQGEEREGYRNLSLFTSVSGAGIALALATGIAQMMLGFSFLEHTHGKVEIPLVGHPHLTTAVLFDLGVYLAVTGSVLAAVEVIGQE